MKLAVWLLALAACRIGFDKRGSDGGLDDVLADVGAPAAFEPYWVNGSRMRARVLRPADGSDPYFLGWRDTLLGMDCNRAYAADGVERCVHGDVRADRFYADAGCTQRLAYLANATCGNAAYAFYRDTSEFYRVHAVGATHTGPVFEDTGTCSASSAPSDGALHVLGPEVPAASMLAAQYDNVPIGPYLRPTQGYSDGSSVELRTLALPLANGCRPITQTLGPSHCRPDVPLAMAVYSDAACLQQAYYWDRQAFDPATTSQLAVIEPAACESASKLYTITSDISAATFYRRTATGCDPEASSALGKLYTATEIANPYPIGSVVIGPRRGRLGYLYWIGPDGRALPSRYWDHDLALPCMPINGSDGKLRCLPRRPTRITAYENGSCSGATSQLAPACYPGTPVDGPDYASCVDYYPVRSLPATSTVASVFTDSCSSFTVADGIYDPSQPGAELPPSMFAELTEIIE